MDDVSAHQGARVVRLAVRDEAASVAEVRATVERVGGDCGLDADAVFALKVAATEAVANALRHPERKDSGVEVTVVADDAVVQLDIENVGAFRVGDGLDPERGRGLPLIVALADEVEFAASPSGTRVRLRMHVEREREAA